MTWHEQKCGTFALQPTEMNKISLPTLFVFLLFFSLFAQGQRQMPTSPNCLCFNKFLLAIEDIDTANVEDLESTLSTAFHELKQQDPSFKRCSDYLSISHSQWSKSKMKMLMSQSGCQITEKTKWLIENGPLIYELGVFTENHLKTQEQVENYEQVSDTILWNAIMNRYAYLKEKMPTFTDEQILKVQHPFYVDFIGKEFILSFSKHMDKRMTEMKLESTVTSSKQNHSFIKQDNVLSTLFEVEVTMTMRGKESKRTSNVLAFSTDSGENWYFVNLDFFKVEAISAIFPFLNSQALQALNNAAKASKYPANTPEELANHYCHCIDNALEMKSIVKEMKCWQMIPKHPVWQQKENRQEMYDAVAKGCPKGEKAPVFNMYRGGK